MRKCRFLLLALLLLTVTFSAAQAQSDSLPIPCLGSDGFKVYLIIDGTRRHIVDWDTFLNLGYQQSQIIPCDADNSDPEGAPITRLFKGSDAPIYWLENGRRRHIPDMDTFAALGFRTSDVSDIPDDLLSLWTLGTPLPSLSATPGDKIYSEQVIGDDTIRLWHPGQGLTDFATITSPYQQGEIRINDVESIGELPTDDIDGDSYPDIEFLTHFPGSHCCSGTVVYDLTPYAPKVLDIHTMGDQPAGGRGDFQDLDGDGVYEFIMQDPLSGIACTQPSVTAILAYDPNQQQYVGASPRFVSYYDDSIPQLTTQAQSGVQCDVYPLITTLLYAGETKNAKAAFDKVYHADDAAAFWAALQASVEHGQFYVAGS